MIKLEAEQLAVVRRILQRRIPGTEVRAFGSRVAGTSVRYSDLDLVVVGESKIDDRIMSRLKDDFSESDLPIMVDILDWNVLSPEFRDRIMGESVVLESGARDFSS